jgi:hypothetical protein
MHRIPVWGISAESMHRTSRIHPMSSDEHVSLAVDSSIRGSLELPVYFCSVSVDAFVLHCFRGVRGNGGSAEVLDLMVLTVCFLTLLNLTR